MQRSAPHTPPRERPWRTPERTLTLPTVVEIVTPLEPVGRDPFIAYDRDAPVTCSTRRPRAGGRR